MYKTCILDLEKKEFRSVEERMLELKARVDRLYKVLEIGEECNCEKTSSKK